MGSAAARRSYERIWCEDRRHELVIAAKDIIAKGVPPETPFWTLAQRLKCSKCGSTKVGIMAARHRDKACNAGRVSRSGAWCALASR